MLKYRCLVLDHDDTAVMSTPAVHYPSFVETLAHLRPGVTMTLDEYKRLNFSPGFERMCYDIFHFTPAEMEWQLHHWQEYVALRIPPFHSGIDRVVRRQKAERLGCPLRTARWAGSLVRRVKSRIPIRCTC